MFREVYTMFGILVTKVNLLTSCENQDYFEKVVLIKSPFAHMLSQLLES